MIPHAVTGRYAPTAVAYLLEGNADAPRQAKDVTRIETRNLCTKESFAKPEDARLAGRIMDAEHKYAQEFKGNRLEKYVFHVSLSLEPEDLAKIHGDDGPVVDPSYLAPDDPDRPPPEMMIPPEKFDGDEMEHYKRILTTPCQFAQGWHDLVGLANTYGMTFTAGCAFVHRGQGKHVKLRDLNENWNYKHMRERFGQTWGQYRFAEYNSDRQRQAVAHPKPKPTKEQRQAREDAFLVQLADEFLAHEAMAHKRAKDEALHFSANELQAVYVVHRDTNNPHVHIAMNRIHPETSKSWGDSYFKRTVREAATDLEKKHGLRVVTHDREDEKPLRMKRDEAYRNSRLEALNDPDRPPTPPRWQRDSLKMMKDRLAPHFAEAESWRDLEARLRAHGVAIFAKGQGWCISDGHHQAKISDMGKKVRIKSLEERLGPIAEHLDSRADPADWLAGRPPAFMPNKGPRRLADLNPDIAEAMARQEQITARQRDRDRDDDMDR